MPGGSKVYYDASCPKCGLIGNDGRGSVWNKQSSPKPSKRSKCKKCGSFLHEQKEDF